jgi:hypothetical protein
MKILLEYSSDANEENTKISKNNVKNFIKPPGLPNAQLTGKILFAKMLRNENSKLYFVPV